LSCVVSSEHVIFPSGTTLVVLNREDGSLKWRLDHPRSYDYISTPVIYRFQGSARDTDAVLISSMDGILYSLDIDTGATLWEYKTGLENTTQSLAPVVDSYSNVYFLDHQKIVAKNEAGVDLWSQEGCNGLEVASSLAISREGMIAAACNDTSLQLFCCR
jgi:outer membrane protein assembly factor BamB